MKILSDLSRVKSISQEIKKFYPRSYLFLSPTHKEITHGSFRAVNGGNHGYVNSRCPDCKHIFSYYKISLGQTKELNKIRCPGCINTELQDIDSDYNKILKQRKSFTSKIFNFFSRRIIRKVGLSK